jgi:hypothetical protein
MHASNYAISKVLVPSKGAKLKSEAMNTNFITTQVFMSFSHEEDLDLGHIKDGDIGIQSYGGAFDSCNDATT